MPTVSYDLTGDNSDLVKAIDETIKKFEGLDKSGAKVDKTIAKQGKTQKKTAQETKGLGSATDVLASKMGISGVEIEKVTGLTAGMALGLAAVAAAAVATAAAMFSLANANSEYVDEIGNLSAQTGLSNETLIALDLAAGRAGVSLEALETGLRGLTQRMGDAVKDGGSAAEVFTDLGISMADVERGSKDSEFALRRTLDAISQLPTEAERASAAIDVFGGRGAKLAAVLKDGSAGLDEMVKRSKELGLVIGEDNVKASEEMDRAMTDLNGSMQAFKNNLGAETTGAVVAVVDALTAFVVITREVALTAYSVQATIKEWDPIWSTLTAVLGTASLALQGVAAGFVDSAADADKHKGSVEGVTQAHRELGDVMDLVADIGKESFAEFKARRKAEVAEEEAALKASRAAAKKSRAAREDAEDAKQAAFEATAAAWRAMLEEMDKAAEDQRAEELSAETHHASSLAEARSEVAKAAAADSKAAADQAASDASDYQEAWMEALGVVMEAAAGIADQLLGVASARAEANAEALEAEIESNRERMQSTRDTLQDAMEAQQEYNLAVERGDAQTKHVLEASGQLLTEKEKEALRDKLKADREANATLEAERKKAVITAFNVDKAAALLSIGISTAKAVMAAAPNPIIMGAMAAVGVTQAAVVAGKQPPSFHDGGLINNVPASAPDEVDIRAKNGEFMVSSQGADGNRETLEAINDGRPTGMGSVTVMIDGEPVADHFVKAAQGDGDVGALFRDPSPKGRNIWR